MPPDPPEHDRRRQDRQPHEAPVILITATGHLPGKQINISPNGALIHAQGHIRIVLKYKGQEYKGHLVRMSRDEVGQGTYAVHLDDELPAGG